MKVSEQRLFWDRTLRRIRRIWPLGDSGKLKDVIDPDLPVGDVQEIHSRIIARLEVRGGEMSARARAAELGEAYLVLNGEGRRRFLELLATDYDVDNQAIDAAIEHRRNSSSPADQEKVNRQLRALLEPPRARLLRQFNELREGVKFLVDLRAELMAWARHDPTLKALDQDVYNLLTSWFDVGFLDLQQITWHTPAALLEKLIEYEAVHAIQSWQDLKNRLGEDRCCYAFFHPRMPDEPLIFVEIALVNGISTSIQDILDEGAPVVHPAKADTAIFYSISNCQPGLAGVSFGNFLIKRVVKALSVRYPNLKTFSTLSPIPGFINWLQSDLTEFKLTEQEGRVVDVLLPCSADSTAMAALIAGEKGDNGHPATGLPENGRATLVHLAARYLTEVKKGDQAHDRVAHFHLANGARIEQINWAADLSAKGLTQSAGMMVNYRYNPGEIEKNHEAYSGFGKVVISSQVKKIL